MAVLCKQDAGWAATWAARVEEQHELLDAAPSAAGRLLDSVLASRRAWPHFAAAPPAGAGLAAPADTASESAVQPAADAGEPAEAAAAAAMDALAAALVGCLGATAVFGGSGNGQPHRSVLIAISAVFIRGL